MNKSLHSFIVPAISLAGLASVGLLPASVLAAQSSQPFTTQLGYGTYGSTAVSQLQEFLSKQGYLSTSPTGNFLSQTQAALKAFQKANGINPNGHFGPQTMAAANAIAENMTGQNAGPAAMIGVQSVSSAGSQTSGQSQSASVYSAVGIANAKTVTWSTANYPAGVGVNINLIQKTSSTPVAYSLVRQIASDAPNTGTYTWTTNPNETSSNLYVEVTCSNANSAAACAVDTQPVNAN